MTSQIVGYLQAPKPKLPKTTSRGVAAVESTILALTELSYRFCFQSIPELGWLDWLIPELVPGRQKFFSDLAFTLLKKTPLTLLVPQQSYNVSGKPAARPLSNVSRRSQENLNNKKERKPEGNKIEQS